MATDDAYTRGDHCVMYTDTELRCTPETSRML